MITVTPICARWLRRGFALAALAATAVPCARAGNLEAAFRRPTESSRSYVYWYWMDGAVSRAGITADLEAMKADGLAGAYLMPVNTPNHPPPFVPPVVVLSPAFWDSVRFAFTEADRLGLKLAMHACDGFSIGGGPWITPALSMQKVVWSEAQVEGGRRIDTVLPQPQELEGYYRDIAVYAYPAPDGAGISTATVRPTVTTSIGGAAPEFLANPPKGNPGPYGQFLDPGTQLFTSARACWIQYAFAEPFTCRSLTVVTIGNATYWANHFLLQVSDDGRHFRDVTRIEPPRHGWQDWDAGVTHALPAVTARYFRFVYDLRNGAPGAEDLDSAKWDPVVKLRGIVLSSEARLDDFEGKSGIVWRVSPPTTAAQVPSALSVPLDRIVDLSGRMDSAGRLQWDAPPGRWTILRMGHTSTGHRNVTGGGGQGLECDKFNPAAARLQFDRWFGEAIRQAGPALSARVLKIFHVDSWECGSQNWSPVFRDEFRRRRGYDPLPYLPAMAGIAVESPEVSERFLHDVRETIADLVVDNFFRPLAELAKAHGCAFSAESLAATMVSDDMAQDNQATLPQGEFWLRSPTNDKLTDILDAASGAHIYDRPIAQAEAFTELHNLWDESPSLLRALGDRNYCFGINRFVNHVFVLNPWLDRKPGLTMNHVGTYFQRDQTWSPTGARAWFDYESRCQSVLQQGRPVADIAVFTGEQVPRRAVAAWQLEPTLPGLIPPRPAGRIIEAGTWVDPLHGYAYDSINRDALLRLARVRDGRIVLPGGASYAILVVPASFPMDPVAADLTPEVADRLRALAIAGATVIVGERPRRSPSLHDFPRCDAEVADDADALWPKGLPADGSIHPLGKGRIITGPYVAPTFAGLGLAPDLTVTTPAGEPATGIAWTHRAGDGWDLYFVSNQFETNRVLAVSLRAAGRVPELWDPVTGDCREAGDWRFRGGRTEVDLRLPPSGSVFVVLRKPAATRGANSPGALTDLSVAASLTGPWEVQFDPARGGPAGPMTFAAATSWSERPEPGIRHYSGTASYSQVFTWSPTAAQPKRVWLDLGSVADVAAVSVNGVSCGVAWTPPYRVEITSALRRGDNWLRIDVANTWFNRLAGDESLPEAERLTWTTAPSPAADAPLRPAGLLGPVTLRVEPGRSVPGPAVSAADLQRVYEAAKTPYKYGIVLQPGPGELFDCPSVFRFGGKWYMLFVSMKDKVGYQTRIAESDDLLHWRPLGKVLPFSGPGWDQWQTDGGAALVDTAWGGGSELQSYDGRYWLSYIGGAKQGYEPDPLSIGLAWTRNPNRPEPWTRLAENPVLSPGQPNARPWERATLYKSTIIWDRSETLGYPFVMYFNGKQKGPWLERIGMAVSSDMRRWYRFGDDPVIANANARGTGISGDPQIVRMGDLWVMFYFGAGWGHGGRAFDTFACSRNLVHWTPWTGPDLIAPSEPWDATYAHKPWLLRYDGVVYHFYCAVGSKGRVIAVATSRDLQ